MEALQAHLTPLTFFSFWQQGQTDDSSILFTSSTITQISSEVKDIQSKHEVSLKEFTCIAKKVLHSILFLSAMINY